VCGEHPSGANGEPELPAAQRRARINRRAQTIMGISAATPTIRAGIPMIVHRCRAFRGTITSSGDKTSGGLRNMARPAAAMTVLDSLRLLYDAGAYLDLEPDDLLDALDAIGVDCFTPEQGPYFAMVGAVLRLLLKHANADPNVMFDGARADISERGTDIDIRAYDEIMSGIEDDRSA
jgi:hypothetical protein